MEKGEIIKLKAFGGEELTRRVVAEEGDTIYVCKESEFQAAIAEGREPISVGFPVETIISKG